MLLATPAWWRSDCSNSRGGAPTAATLWGATLSQGEPGDDGLAFFHSSVFLILSS